MAKPKGKKVRKPGPGKGAKGIPNNNKGAPVGHMNRLSSGHHISKRILRDVKIHGSRSRALSAVMNGKSDWNIAIRKWREDLIASLGGAAAFNVEAWELLNVLQIDKIINDSISAFIASNPIINLKRRRCFEIILQRTKLSGDYIGRLKQLRESVKRSKEFSMDEIRASLKVAEDETS